MAGYFTDMEDIEFNLFNFLEIQNYKKFGLEVNDMKGIISEYNKFVENEIYPSRETSDIEGVKLEDGQVYVSKAIHKFHKKFYENGWFALGLEEELGGYPVPETLALSCISLATGANVAYTMYPGLSRAALNVIKLKASKELKDKYLQGMATGKWGGTMCLTEAGAGSDVGALRTTATPNDDGSYNIKGVKIFISSGDSDLYENNIHLVLARTPGAAAGTKGISLFLVPKNLVNDDSSLAEFNNVRCTKIEHKMGIHASATCELTFGDEGESKGWLIGNEFEGMQNMFIMMNEARLTCSIQGESQANLAYLMSLNYAKERIQFDTEIHKHGDVRRMLLKMRAVSRGLRALVLYSADLFDKAHEDPSFNDLIGFMTPICKAYSTEEGFFVASEAVQIHGGYGFCQEYGVEQFVRDSIIGRIYEGTNGIQALDLVTRKILKDQGKTLKVVSDKIEAFVSKIGETYPSEQKLFVKSLKNYQEVLMKIQGLAQEKKFNTINQNSFDVLMMSSHLIVAWLLGEQSLKAQASAGELNADYVKTKSDDFKIYCKYYLTKNLGIARSILLEDISLDELVL